MKFVNIATKIDNEFFSDFTCFQVTATYFKLLLEHFPSCKCMHVLFEQNSRTVPRAHRT